ncbi:MAG TPA: LPS assembly lipoprotein LptE [Moraxellaceae bacterium]|nr:LPS assembly lipoprotein LptE [Moraxellaceae bacterium]
MMRPRNANTPLRLALLLPLLLALAACGFQLRGSYRVPAFLTAVDLKLPAGTRPLGTELRLALERKGIGADGGDVQLEVVSERLNRQASSVDSRARAAEYILVYTVDFRINSSDGRAVGPLETLILRRSYQYSTQNVVGKNTEEETLVRELRADAAQQIVRQLATMKVSPAAPDPAAGNAAAPPAAPAPAGVATPGAATP